jgi:1-acyl-sn-glycerol-3-phosphate acyltransferase
MPKLSVILHTLFSRLMLILILIVGAPVILMMMVVPEKYRYQNRVMFWGLNLLYWAIIKFTFVPVTLKGYDLACADQKPVVFIANHQSALDIPLLGVYACGRPHIWLARIELMKWKLLRWVLPRLAVVIDTESREKAMGSMRRLLRLTQGKNIDVMLFPEGARYADDKVHKFYGGFVTLAKLLKRSVVPVYISGVNKVYPPGTFWVTRHPIEVTVGEPFTLKEGESDDEFKDRVHRWFVEQSER